METFEFRINLPLSRRPEIEELLQCSPEEVMDVLLIACRVMEDVRSFCKENTTEEHQAEIDSIKNKYISDITEMKEAHFKELTDHSRSSLELFSAERVSMEAEMTNMQTCIDELKKRNHQILSTIDDEVNQRVKSIQADIHRNTSSEIERLKTEKNKLDKEIAETTKIMENNMNMYNQQLETERSFSQRRIGEIEEQQSLRVKELQEFVNSYKEQAQQARKEKDVMVENLHSRFDSIFAGGSQVKGSIGENIIDEVFADLELGTMTDVSKNTGQGDRLWEYDFQSHRVGSAGVPKLQAMVEIKNVKDRLHSKHDIGKFENDIISGIQQNRINAAILISLSARVSGTKQVDLKFEHGIPVLRVSRNSDDSIPASNMVKLAFITLAEVWPFITYKREESVNSIVEDMISHVDTQLISINSLTRQINSLEKSGLQLQRDSVALKKTRDSMLKQVEILKIQHPCMWGGDKVEADDDGGEEEIREACMNAIIKYRQDKGRYPQAPKQLTMLETDQILAIGTQLFESVVKDVRGINAKKRKKSQPTEVSGEISEVTNTLNSE